MPFVHLSRIVLPRVLSRTGATGQRPLRHTPDGGCVSLGPPPVPPAGARHGVPRDKGLKSR